MTRSRAEARLLWVLLAGIALVWVPVDAAAYCRTTTVPVPPSFNPSSGCHSGGLPLWWRSQCVSYSIQKDASREIDLADVTRIIDEAFARWPRADCGPGTPSIVPMAVGPVDCTEVRYNTQSSNQNLIVFRSDVWPHNDASNTLALTTMSFDVDSGEIYDADMEINDAQYKPNVGPGATEGYDLPTVVTHEAGHFLGLAHAQQSSSLMSATYHVGFDLQPDDIAGICSIYLADGRRAVDPSIASGYVSAATCDPTPRHGFTTACEGTPLPVAAFSGTATTPPHVTGGCAVARAGSATHHCGWLGALAAGAALLRRRRNRPRFIS